MRGRVATGDHDAGQGLSNVVGAGGFDVVHGAGQAGEIRSSRPVAVRFIAASTK